MLCCHQLSEPSQRARPNLGPRYNLQQSAPSLSRSENGTRCGGRAVPARPVRETDIKAPSGTAVPSTGARGRSSACRRQGGRRPHIASCIHANYKGPRARPTSSLARPPGPLGLNPAGPRVPHVQLSELSSEREKRAAAHRPIDGALQPRASTVAGMRRPHDPQLNLNSLTGGLLSTSAGVSPLKYANGSSSIPTVKNDFKADTFTLTIPKA